MQPGQLPLWRGCRPRTLVSMILAAKATRPVLVDSGRLAVVVQDGGLTYIGLPESWRAVPICMTHS